MSVEMIGESRIVRVTLSPLAWEQVSKALAECAYGLEDVTMIPYGVKGAMHELRNRRREWRREGYCSVCADSRGMVGTAETHRPRHHDITVSWTCDAALWERIRSEAVRMTGWAAHCASDEVREIVRKIAAQMLTREDFALRRV